MRCHLGHERVREIHQSEREQDGDIVWPKGDGRIVVFGLRLVSPPPAPAKYRHVTSVADEGSNSLKGRLEFRENPGVPPGTVSKVWWR